MTVEEDHCDDILCKPPMRTVLMFGSQGLTNSQQSMTRGGPLKMTVKTLYYIGWLIANKCLSERVFIASECSKRTIIDLIWLIVNSK